MTEASSASPRRLSAFTRLLPHLAPHRALIAGWLGFLALSSTATLTLPQAVRVMIDRGFAHADAATINTSFLGLFAVAAVLAVATAGRFFCVALLGERVAWLIEELGLYGPMTISDLSRRSGVHVSIVSRTVAMLEPEGWIVRIPTLVLPGDAERSLL